MLDVPMQHWCQQRGRETRASVLRGRFSEDVDLLGTVEGERAHSQARRNGRRESEDQKRGDEASHGNVTRYGRGLPRAAGNPPDAMSAPGAGRSALA